MTVTTRRISIWALGLSLALLVAGAAATVQGQKTKTAPASVATTKVAGSPAPAASAASTPAQAPARPARKPQKPSAAGAAAPRLNLNTATAAQLDGLPGIGPKTAERIIEYRQKIGSFQKIEQLMNVRGVGEKNFLRLKDRITVGPAKPASHKS